MNMHVTHDSLKCLIQHEKHHHTTAFLLLMAVSSPKSHAHCTTCKNHLRSMGLAPQMYVHDRPDPFWIGWK